MASPNRKQTELPSDLDSTQPPFGATTGGRWRTCQHCGTVTRALTPLPQHVHDTCGCPCHAWRMGKLTASDSRWQKKQSKRKRDAANAVRS